MNQHVELTRETPIGKHRELRFYETLGWILQTIGKLFENSGELEP